MSEKKPRLDRPILVEGKYDKIKLDSLFDGLILTCEGFSLFRRQDKQAFLRRLSDEKGLMNILEDETDFEHTVKKNLNNTNMDVLFCGNKKVNSANLMISPKFRELMKKVKKEYDYAFLDVSCHLGTADIVSAGSTADSVLLLVRAGKTEEASAKQTIEALNRANLDISGVILNGVEEV